MLNKSLIQGSLSMLILRLLDEKDMYGYEMIETLRSRSENVFELKAGSLYPLLHTLEANNLVTAYEDDASGKTRKYYHITREGRRILKEKKEDPVKDLATGRVYISSQNHGYVVDTDTLDPKVAKPAFVNVNDGTNEGLEYVGKNIFTVQFHPEACPGPQDSSYLFDRFIQMMGGNQ